MAAIGTVRKIKETVGKSMAKQQIEFTFHAPESKKIFVAGTFNDWNTKSLPMKKDKDGTWRIMIKLSPGRYEYKYFVDGRWAQECSGAELIPNPFGTYNCKIEVE